MFNNEAPLKLKPLVTSLVDRPVSMSDEVSLGTLDLMLAVLTQQLSDYFTKTCAVRLNLREVSIMSVSRIESSLQQLLEDQPKEIEAGAVGGTPASSSSTSASEKKSLLVLRATHTLLHAIEENIFLILSHVHFFLARDGASRLRSEREAQQQLQQQQQYQGTPVRGARGGDPPAYLLDNSRKTQQRMGFAASISSKIGDELVGSVSRSLQKLSKLLEARRANDSPEQEASLLQEKMDFIAFAESWLSKCSGRDLSFH